MRIVTWNIGWRFGDRWRELGRRTLRSEHRWAPRDATAQLDRRIDHVLVRRAVTDRPITVQRAVTVPDPVDGPHASDHDPVVVDLELPSAP